MSATEKVPRGILDEAREKGIVGKEEIEALKTKYYNQAFMKNWQEAFNNFQKFARGEAKAVDREAAEKKDLEFGASGVKNWGQVLNCE